MIATAVFKGGVNVRSSPSLSASTLFQTVVPDFATLLGTSKIDGDAYTWLHVEFDNGTQGYVRADVTYVIGNLSLIGGGVYADPTLANVAFPTVGSSAQPPVGTPTSPVAASGLWQAPVTPSTNENDYGHVYEGVKHDGVDLAGPLGSPIYASADGVAVLVHPSAHGKVSVLDVGIPLNSPAVLNDIGWSYGYGNVCVVRYPRAALPASAQAAISDAWVFVLVAHCDDLVTSQGATVKAGTLLAHRGKSGNANGVHVHLSVGTSNDASPSNVWGLPKINPHLLYDIPTA